MLEDIKSSDERPLALLVALPVALTNFTLICNHESWYYLVIPSFKIIVK
jgi:hypothetical protein